LEAVAEKLDLEFVPRSGTRRPRLARAALIHYPSNRRIYTYPPGYPRSKRDDTDQDETRLSEQGAADQSGQAAVPGAVRLPADITTPALATIGALLKAFGIA
jgi:hypothetical protein